MALSQLRADRLVTLGSLAVRPVLHRGANGAVFPTSNEPIYGLSVRILGSRARALFHPSTNVHGFVDLPPGPDPVLVGVTDPENRFLPRTLRVTVPDQTSLREALALGAQAPPATASPPFVTAHLRPSPSGPARASYTSVYGVAREADGRPIAWAWVRVSTPQGRYVTYTDLRGEYLAILPFLRPVVTVVDEGDLEGDSDDLTEVQSTFSADVSAHRLLAPIPASGDPLTAFPPTFDDLAPEIPGFEEVYEESAFFLTTVPIKVETHHRLDLLPV
jgi:hypothetical protein